MGTKVLPESQARELAPLKGDPDKVREVYRRAEEATGGKVTAKAIREAREESDWEGSLGAVVCRRAAFAPGAGRRRNWRSPDAYVALRWLQDDKCGICGWPLPRAPINGEVHIDHVVPLARGGADEKSNLQLAHAVCNLRKGARMPEPLIASWRD